MNVKQRIFYQFDIVLTSPLSTGTGNSIETDHDVLCDDHGVPYLTGASVAGALRAYLHQAENATENVLFGYTETKDKKTPMQMSRLFFSDVVFEKHTISARDGVSLDEDKTAKDTGKFDYQIIETGAAGSIRIEAVIYGGDKFTVNVLDSVMREWVCAVNQGAIRFGFKKTRGLGCFRVTAAKQRVFDFSAAPAETAKAYLTFMQSGQNDYEPFALDDTIAVCKNDWTGTFQLKQHGGISIRTYSAKKGEPDFATLTTNDVPVIPGSSWNGAIRARVIDILENDLQASVLKKELEEVWGKLDEMKFQASQVIISESEINGGVDMKMTRVCLNRFSGGALESALYTEKSHFQGKTQLSIRVKNGMGNHKWVVALILLAVQDIQNGLLSVGGQTAVGRGIFAGKTDFSAAEYQQFWLALNDKTHGGEKTHES